MMKAALVVKFTTPVPGREKAAIEYMHEVDDFYGKKAAEGLCTVPTWLWASDDENLWIVEGEYEALLGLLAMPEVQKLLAKGSILSQSFRYDLYRVGRDEILGPWQDMLKELAII